MNEKLDPKELKVLSDILALVLEDQDGQASNALNALRSRARRNAITGGALKNLFVAIAPNPPQRAKPRARATKADTGAEAIAARQRISALTADLQQLDLELRSSRARIESLRSELHQTQQSRAEIQSVLHARQSRQLPSPRSSIIWLAVGVGALLGIAGTQLTHSVLDAPRFDRAELLR